MINFKQEEEKINKKKEILLKRRQKLDEEIASFDLELLGLEKFKKDIEKAEMLKQKALETYLNGKG